MGASLIRFIAVFSVLLASGECRASLGQNSDSVAGDADAIVATRHEIETKKAFTVHLITDGTLVVREYVSNATGQVFALTWSGRRDPQNLSALLGDYMTEYVQGLQRARAPLPGVARIHSPHAVIQGPHLRVERDFHIRAVRARAFLGELPEGVRADEIR